jgi:hypothetical protein
MNPMVVGPAPGQRGKVLCLHSRGIRGGTSRHLEYAEKQGRLETGHGNRVHVKSALSDWVRAEVTNFFDSS